MRNIKYVACKQYDSSVEISGSVCLTSMAEVFECIAQPDTDRLVLRRDFTDEYFTPTGLAEFVKDIKSVNKHISIVTDADTIEYGMDGVKFLKSIKTPSEFIYAMEARPKYIFDTIRMLCSSYEESYTETLLANNRVSTQHLKISSLERELKNREDDYQELSKRERDASDRLHILISRINYKYGHNINMETLLKSSSNNYVKVLYIKEITRVHYMDTFIYYLQEIMRTLYSIPCRLCVMESFYAYDNSELYPDLKRSWDMTANDVYNSDIFMAGYQPSLMEDILKNSSNIRYLIVLDRAGGFDVHITGGNVEYLYCVSDLKDMSGYEYDKTRMVSYDRSTLFIPHVKGFDSMSNEEKMGAYSSMDIMKHVIEILERS